LREKKALARDLNELQEVRAVVRKLVADGKTPEQIAEKIGRLPYIKKSLEFAVERFSKFSDKQVAIFTLKPWLPDHVANAILGALFRRDPNNISTSNKSFETTSKDILRAAEWMRHGGVHLSYLAKKTGHNGERTFSESGAEWRKLARLMPADGFDPINPVYGYRRPESNDEPLPWHVSELQPTLRTMVEKDPRLEEILRSRETRWDEEKGPRLRESLLLIIQGWVPITAMRHMKLDMPKTTFLGLLRNPKLCGMMLVGKQRELWNLKVNESILSGEEFVILQLRIPPRGGKHLFGLIWEKGDRIADADGEETWMVDNCYTMHIESQMGFTRIAQLTGLSRDTVRHMFEREEYKAIVGEERWIQGRAINTLHARVADFKAASSQQLREVFAVT